MKVDLTYNIYQATLYGVLGDNKIHIPNCFSGGRGGSKLEGVEDICLVNNPMFQDKRGEKEKLEKEELKKTKKGKMTKVTENVVAIGGVIPEGYYKMIPKIDKEGKIKENWISLEPLSGVNGNTKFGRDGMAIHGQGNIGSQGCIVVPTSRFVILRDVIFPYIKNLAYESEKSKLPTLKVLNGIEYRLIQKCKPLDQDYIIEFDHKKNVWVHKRSANEMRSSPDQIIIYNKKK